MTGDSMAAPDDDRLGPVVESFLARFRRGERPALTDLAARHPELAGQIRELIPALVELEQLGGGGAVPSSPGLQAGVRGRGGDASPPDRLGDYVILRLIGGGGMGVVYEAEHESLKSRVALKVMHPRFRADAKYLHRFHAEARLAAGLHHTNIVSVFDYGEQDGVCYYAMQFIQGQPLDLVLADIHRLRDEGPGGTLGLGSPGVAASSIAARGLLTGRYGAPSGAATAEAGLGADLGAGPGPTGPVAPAIRAATSRAGDEDSGATLPLPEAQASTEPGPAPAGSIGDGAAISSTSLGGSGEQRYFREIARVGAQVADALEYAHRRGVLHRDIKPSNLLLDALGNVWVTDFGLAKLEEGDDLTQSHELVGTLRYMAPERFRGKSGRGGDVYSLGATLYELLTLRPPFRETDQIRLIERIREEAPAPPRQLDRNVPRDLETIVLKALAKDPKDRFGSAGGLAGELRRFVEGRPIRSRPVSLAEQFWRWCKRERGMAVASIAAAILTIVLLVGFAGAAWVYRDKVREIGVQRDRIGQALEDLRRADFATRKNLFDAQVARARATRFSRRPGQRFESLAALGEAAEIARSLRLPPEELDRIRDETIACLALPDLEPTGRVIAHPPRLAAFAMAPSMARYAVRMLDGTISVRRESDDGEIGRFASRGDRDFWVFEFSPDGRYLASGDSHGTPMNIWDVDRGAVAVSDPGPVGHQLAWNPDGRRLLLSRSSTLVEYDLTTGRVVRTRPGEVHHLVFRPDGARIAVIDGDLKDQTCRILEADSGRLVRTFRLGARAGWVAWSPDGRTLAVARTDRPIDLWDAETGVRRATMEGLTSGGPMVAFHPTGALLVSNGWESRLRLWDPILARPVLSLTGGGGIPLGRDGRVVVGAGDRQVFYRIDAAPEYRTFAHASGRPTEYQRASIHPGGRLLIVGGPARRSSGTWRGAPSWPRCRSVRPGTSCSSRPATCSPAGRPACTGGRSGWIPPAVSSGSGRRDGSPCRSPAASSTRTGRGASWSRPITRTPRLRCPGGRSASARWTTAAGRPSARMGRGWRRGATSGAPRSGTSPPARSWPSSPSTPAPRWPSARMGRG